LFQSSDILDDTTSSVGRVGTYAYLNQAEAFSWSSYAVDLKMRSADDDGLGVMFYYKDSTHYYRFEMDSQRSFRRLIKKVHGTAFLLAENSTGYVRNRSYAVRVEVSMGKMRVQVDGVDQFGGLVSDQSLFSGSIALYCWGNAGSGFDDVVVTSLGGADLQDLENVSGRPQPESPETFGVTQNYPNPFNPSTTVEYHLPGAGRVYIKIYDNRGREIRALENGAEKSPGFYRVSWDGKDQIGMAVPSGLYICLVKFGGRAFTRKMMLMK
jgi:hypothetical protein